MSRFKRKHAVGAIVAGLALFAGWYFWGLANAPLLSLNQTNLEQFKQDFNKDANETRLVLLLSPT